MTAYRRVCDSRHLQADCQEPGSAPEPYARQSSMGYLYLFTPHDLHLVVRKLTRNRRQVGERTLPAGHRCKHVHTHSHTAPPDPSAALAEEYNYNHYRSVRENSTAENYKRNPHTHTHTHVENAPPISV